MTIDTITNPKISKFNGSSKNAKRTDTILPYTVLGSQTALQRELLFNNSLFNSSDSYFQILSTSGRRRLAHFVILFVHQTQSY